MRRAARLASLALVLLGAGAPAFAHAPDPLAPVSPFYAANEAQLAAGPRGSLIRAEPMADAPAGARAWRVLYRSLGAHGEAAAVSGIVVIPRGAAPEEGRPVVAWAHPTSGVVPRCAPSNARFWYDQIQGLRPMLERGWVVAATDYAGLGTRGPHPYLVGTSEAAALLDAVRAARALPDTGAGARYALWGHSQGGQAALFAAEEAAAEAPELTLVGVAVAAPPTDLATLLRDDLDSDGGRNLAAMTLWSWTRLYGLSDDGLVDPASRRAIDVLSKECIETVVDVAERMVSQRPLRERFLRTADVTRVEPWQTMLRENSPPPLRDADLLVVQGDADALVRPAVTLDWARASCRAGSAVRYLELPGGSHGFAARDAAGAAVAWMARRFAGLAPEDDCARMAPEEHALRPATSPTVARPG